MPELPSVEEAGVPGYEYHTWFGLWAPKGTPQPIVDKLNAEVTKALADPVVKQRIAAGAGEPSTMALQGHRAFHEGRDRQMGRGGQARRDQGRVAAAVIGRASAAPADQIGSLRVMPQCACC